MSPERDKQRKWAIFLLIPLHVLFYFLTVSADQGPFLFFCLCMILADFVLSFLDMEIFSSGRGRIGIFAQDFLPHLGKKTLIAAADFVIFLILNATQHHDFDGFIIDNEGLWLAICIAMMILSLLVTFVTGAAATMLHHDDAGKR